MKVEISHRVTIDCGKNHKERVSKRSQFFKRKGKGKSLSYLCHNGVQWRNRQDEQYVYTERLGSGKISGKMHGATSYEINPSPKPWNEAVEYKIP